MKKEEIAGMVGSEWKEKWEILERKLLHYCRRKTGYKGVLRRRAEIGLNSLSPNDPGWSLDDAHKIIKIQVLGMLEDNLHLKMRGRAIIRIQKFEILNYWKTIGSIVNRNNWPFVLSCLNRTNRIIKNRLNFFRNYHKETQLDLLDLPWSSLWEKDRVYWEYGYWSTLLINETIVECYPPGMLKSFRKHHNNLKWLISSCLGNQ